MFRFPRVPPTRLVRSRDYRSRCSGARALIGSEVRAYGFDLGAEYSPEASIQAEAEFHGDERGGEFQLSDLRLLDDH